MLHRTLPYQAHFPTSKSPINLPDRLSCSFPLVGPREGHKGKDESTPERKWVDSLSLLEQPGIFGLLGEVLIGATSVCCAGGFLGLLCRVTRLWDSGGSGWSLQMPDESHRISAVS